MFEELMNLIKDNSQEAVVNNPDVPNEQNEAVMQEAGVSITSTLQSMLAGGQAKEVLGLFNSSESDIQSQPAMQQISGNFMSGLTEKFGLNGQQAGSIAGSLLPNILGKLVNKTNNPNDSSFNIQDIFNSLSNNGTSGMNIPGMLSKLTSGGGLDRDGDGDVDFNDLTAAFSGMGQAGSGNAPGGGMLDKLKGMFGG